LRQSHKKNNRAAQFIEQSGSFSTHWRRACNGEPTCFKPTLLRRSARLVFLMQFISICCDVLPSARSQLVMHVWQWGWRSSKGPGAFYLNRICKWNASWRIFLSNENRRSEILQSPG